MLIELSDLYAVFPKHIAARLFPNKTEKELQKRLKETIQRQEKIVTELLGKIPENTPETIKWAVAARSAYELSFEGSLEDLKEKYKLLNDEARKMLKDYKDGTILPKDIGGKTVLYSKGVKKRFNFFGDG